MTHHSACLSAVRESVQLDLALSGTELSASGLQVYEGSPIDIKGRDEILLTLNFLFDHPNIPLSLPST